MNDNYDPLAGRTVRALYEGVKYEGPSCAEQLYQEVIADARALFELADQDARDAFGPIVAKLLDDIEHGSRYGDTNRVAWACLSLGMLLGSWGLMEAKNDVLRRKKPGRKSRCDEKIGEIMKVFRELEPLHTKAEVYRLLAERFGENAHTIRRWVEEDLKAEN